MGASKRDGTKQDKHAGLCRRVGKMGVLTRCGACNQPVVGVVLGRRTRYCIECKNCGYSASSHFSDGNGPPTV
jgi:transcription elongation factor Elf1